MNVLAVGGGMICHDQILPSLFQLQRKGRIGEIEVCARRAETLAALHGNARIASAFPGQNFASATGEFRERIAALPPQSLVVVGLPDHMHYEAVIAALEHDQHVLCVKPLVMRGSESVQIRVRARERGLLVAVEYHKRFDDRSHMARLRYRAGEFGEFRLGTACLLEKWRYRHSNFQSWFADSDPFTYVGCHYVDLVHFITGLMPVEASVYGIKERLPNGVEAYLWSDARVIWSNDACLNVQNGLGFPDRAPGSNTQGLTMYFSTPGGGGWLAHSDQYRGLQYCLRSSYEEPSPDYFTYVEYGGPGLAVAGYGYRSIEYSVECALSLRDLPLERRQARLKEIDDAGLVATPANAGFNDWVIEAARESILDGGRVVQVKAG